jgi:lipoprotein-anchoring transpeptidase ErfK/SrfK
MSMIWRTALAAAAAASLLDIQTASAQWFPEQEGYGRAPFWEDRPRGRQGWRDDYYDDWGYSGDDRRQPITRSGGARPVIAPVAPPKVAFRSNFTPNSIVIDSEGRMLYYILSPIEAYQYPISVGREGFSWTGTEVISRTQAWPDWHPPKEMIARDKRLPDKMTGGLNNPLGALALYLGNTLYRIHGTNDPNSIGRAASSGCFRMMNEHVLHLASIARVGTPVTVVKRLPTHLVAAPPIAPPVARAEPQDVGPYGRERESYADEDGFDDPRGYDPYDADERYEQYDGYPRYRWGRRL